MVSLVLTHDFLFFWQTAFPPLLKLISKYLKSSTLWLRWKFNRNLQTWTRDSGRLIFIATSSLMNMSGYLVLWNKLSRRSSWAREYVVRSRRCFLPCPRRGKKIYLKYAHENASNWLATSPWCHPRCLQSKLTHFGAADWNESSCLF